MITALTRSGLAIAALAMLALAVAGCGGGSGAASDRAEQQLATRPHYPSCGSTTLMQGQGAADSAGVACLNRHLADHTPAEYAVTAPTTEGDPMTTYYRVTPQGHLEKWIDSTQDRFRGDAAATYFDCGTREKIDSLAC